MKENINCPFWNEKKGYCKLVSAKQNEVNRLIDIIWQQNDIIDGYAPPKTSLGPVPGSHGMAEGHSSIIGMPLPPVDPQKVSKFMEYIKKAESKILHPPTDSQPVDLEEVEKKQEYWEKELKKMDKEKKKE